MENDKKEKNSKWEKNKRNLKNWNKLERLWVNLEK